MKYDTSVDWSDDDNCYIGSIVDVPNYAPQCCHGDTIKEVEEQLVVIVAEWKANEDEDEECS